MTTPAKPAFVEIAPQRPLIAIQWPHDPHDRADAIAALAARHIDTAVVETEDDTPYRLHVFLGGAAASPGDWIVLTTTLGKTYATVLPAHVFAEIYNVAAEPDRVFIERYGIHHATFGGIDGDVTQLVITREAWRTMGEADVLTVRVDAAEPDKEDGV